MALKRIFKLALAYMAMFVPLLIVTALVWSLVAPERLYHCWDDAPFSTFIPPFVHPEFTLSERHRDYFILPPKTVYSIWGAFVGVAALAPAVVVLAVARLWRFYERRRLFTRHAKSDLFRTV